MGCCSSEDSYACEAGLNAAIKNGPGNFRGRFLFLLVMALDTCYGTFAECFMTIGTIFMCPLFAESGDFPVRFGFMAHGTIAYLSCLMPKMIEDDLVLHFYDITVGKGVCCNKNQ